MKNLNQNDIINRLYLISNNELKADANKRYSLDNIMLENYIDYLYCLTRNYTIKFYKDSTFLENFKANIKNQLVRDRIILTEKIFADILRKLKNKEIHNLTEREWTIIRYKSEGALNDYIRCIDVLPKPIEDKELLEKLKSHFMQSKYIQKYRKWKIENIYTVDKQANKRFEDKNYSNKIELAHGTKNSSLIQILSTGFKKASEMDKNEYNYSGSSLGDGIYFAKIEQMDKCLGYIDRQFNPYIIIADVYYNNRIVTDEFERHKLTGTNMIHAKNMGAYGRDEFVVSPSQIQIKYLLELR